MQKFDSYIIVSDLDGTFFGEKASVLKNNLEAIQYFKENGGKFTFATGRDYKILEHQFPQLLNIPNCPGILCNGVYLYDFEKKITSKSLEIDKIELLNAIEVIKEAVPESTFRISFPDGFLCSKENQLPFPVEQKTFFDPILTWDSLKNQLDVPWYKLVYCYVKSPNTENWIEKVKEVVQKLDLKNIDTVPSAGHLLEFLPKGTGKGLSLFDLRDLYPNRKIICVGDYDNDLSMLKAADIAACPENAIDPVKNICSIHLCHHREGCIADLIYKLESSIKK